MKTNVSVYDFRDTIMELRPNNFSYEGLTILFGWFEQYEEDSDQEIDFDPIAICCEFNESTEDEIINDYDLGTDVDNDKIEEWLNDRTMVAGVTESGDYIYAAF